MRKLARVLVFVLILLSISLPSADASTIETIGIPDVHIPDPLLIENPTDFWLSSLIWQPLTWYENGQVYPVIAESWTSSGTLWTFKIKKHLTWKDGSTLTATDVVNTYNYLLHMPINHRRGATIWLLISNIRSVETASDNTVVFQLYKPYGDFAKDVTSNVFILPKHLRNYKMKTHNIWGSGMYYVNKTTSENIVLKRNPNYKGYVPYPETLIFTSNLSKTNNYITYPAPHGTQQYHISLRLVFNTKKQPFTTWPYRYLLITTLPYNKLTTTGTAGTPCLMKSPLCHSSLHIDRLVFDANEFIENYSIDIDRLQNLTLAVPPFLEDVAQKIVQGWEKIGIHVNIKTVPLYTMLHNPPDVNMIIIPIGGSTSPYTLASPDFPFCQWNYPNFFIKLSEGITGDHTKLITALEILDYTYPSTTIQFPKVYINLKTPYLKKHIAGLGIPMLTSPIDDPTIGLYIPPEETTGTASTSTTAGITNKRLTYLKMGLIAVIVISLILLLLIFLVPRIKTLWTKIIHFPTLLVFGSIGSLLSKLKKKAPSQEEETDASQPINEENNEHEPAVEEETAKVPQPEETKAVQEEAEEPQRQEETAEHQEKTESEEENISKQSHVSHNEETALSKVQATEETSHKTNKVKEVINNIAHEVSSIWSNLIPKFKQALKRISEKTKTLKNKGNSKKTQPTDEMLKKTTETIISHIEKVGMHQEENIPENTTISEKPNEETIPDTVNEVQTSQEPEYAEESSEEHQKVDKPSQEDNSPIENYEKTEDKTANQLTDGLSQTASTSSQEDMVNLFNEKNRETMEDSDIQEINNETYENSQESVDSQEPQANTSLSQEEIEKLFAQQQHQDSQESVDSQEPQANASLSQEEIEKLFAQQQHQDSQEPQANASLSQEEIEKLFSQQQHQEEKTSIENNEEDTDTQTDTTIEFQPDNSNASSNALFPPETSHLEELVRMYENGELPPLPNIADNDETEEGKQENNEEDSR